MNFNALGVALAAESSGQLKSCESSRCVAEGRCLQTQSLQHTDKQIAQGWRVIGIKGQMLSVPETAPRQQHGQVADRMTAGISEIAAEEHCCSFQQIRVLLLRAPQLCQQLPDGFERFLFDQSQLLKFLRVPAMV